MKVLRLLAALAALPLLLLLWSYGEAISQPVVRRAELALPGLPVGTRPIRAVLISDVHVAGPDMPPGRLSRIIDQINALRPDIVLIAGDLVSDKRTATHLYPTSEALAPLGKLRPRLATIAVLGNHDHWRDAASARAALRKAGVILLENDARQVGPLAIGGLDDDFTGRADVSKMAARLRRLRGARLVLSHSPDPFPGLPRDIPLMLAGHTHCGQITLPFYGPIENVSRHGLRYQCGLVRERGQTLVVTAGLGTSVVPLRFNAPPDLWLIELGP